MCRMSTVTATNTKLITIKYVTTVSIKGTKTVTAFSTTVSTITLDPATTTVYSCMSSSAAVGRSAADDGRKRSRILDLIAPAQVVP
jgi:hypothetical protein